MAQSFILPVKKEIQLLFYNRHWTDYLLFLSMLFLMIGGCFSLSLLEIGKGISLLYLLLSLIFYKEVGSKLYLKVILSALPFLIWFLITSLIHQTKAEEVIIYLGRFVVLFVALNYCLRFQRFTLMALVFVLFSSVLNVFNIITYFQLDEAYKRLQPFNFHKLQLSSILMISCSFLLWLVFEMKGRVAKVCLGFLFLFHLFGLSVLSERLHFFGFAGLFLFIIIMTMSWKYYLPIAAILSIVFAFVIPEKTMGKFAAMFKSGSGDQYRLALWTAGLKIIPGSPIIGYGLGNMRPYMKKYMTFKYDPKRPPYHSHMLFISLANYFGIPGLVLFMLAFGYWIILGTKRFWERFWKGRDVFSIILSSLLFIWVVNMVLDTIFFPINGELFLICMALWIFSPLKKQSEIESLHRMSEGSH